MEAGKLRHRVTLQRSTISPDGYGGVVEMWLDVATFWASIMPIRGIEYNLAMQQQADITHRVTSRYITDATPADRIKFGTRIFNVVDVKRLDERNITQEYTCKEVVT